MQSSCYWDTCLFIDLLQRTNQKRLDACEHLRAKAEKKELLIVTSTWTLIEVNKLPGAKALPKEQSEQIIKFFENPYIVLRQLDRPTAELTHELIRDHGLTNADAVHVATALMAKVPVFYTFDAVKHKRKGLLKHHMKIGSPPLAIQVPPEPSFGPLFEGTEGKPV